MKTDEDMTEQEKVMLLREMVAGSCMLECKKVLKVSEGDFNKALELLQVRASNRKYYTI